MSLLSRIEQVNAGAPCACACHPLRDPALSGCRLCVWQRQHVSLGHVGYRPAWVERAKARTLPVKEYGR